MRNPGRFKVPRHVETQGRGTQRVPGSGGLEPKGEYKGTRSVDGTRYRTLDTWTIYKNGVLERTRKERGRPGLGRRGLFTMDLNMVNMFTLPRNEIFQCLVSMERKSCTFTHRMFILLLES